MKARQHRANIGYKMESSMSSQIKSVPEAVTKFANVSAQVSALLIGVAFFANFVASNAEPLGMFC